MILLQAVIGLGVQLFGILGAVAASDLFVTSTWEEGALFLLNSLPLQMFLVFFLTFLIFWNRKAERQPKQPQPRKSPQIQADLAKAESLAVMRERARLARELHDTLGHTLTALEIQLELADRLPPERNQEMQDAIQKARRLVKDGLSDVRRAVQALHPSALDVLSLPEAIENLIEDFQRDRDVSVQWQVKGETKSIPPHLMLPLYRAAQEGLTNIRKHAIDCSEVVVVLQFDADSLALTIENDGCNNSSPEQGYGLEGLCARAEALQGTFCAHPIQEGWFRLYMKLPI